MRCPNCGKENKDNVISCDACGSALVPKTTIAGPAMNLSKDGEHFKKSSVVLTILLTLATAGIYYPIWFLRQMHYLNRLQSKKKLNKWIFITAIIIISIGVSFELGIYESVVIGTVSKILSAVVGIVLIVQCFKVIEILREHHNDYLKRDLAFSEPATFFFGIYYIQYKINRL